MFVARKLFFSASMVSSSAVRKNAWRGSRNRFPVMDRFFSLSDRSEVTSSPSVATIADAKAMPRHYNEMPGSVILNMAVSGDQEAREERLIREIMATDNIEWPAAREKFVTIMRNNRQGLFVATLPYKIGIFTAVSAGLLSIPLIFHLETVLLFNENFVTTDVPDDKDLETPLEVASWAWNWMEPPLGQISFFLLCMQYARAQLENLGAKPYTAAYKARRAANLCKAYPAYNKCILTSFSEGDSFSPDENAEHIIRDEVQI